jgi:hypothetical protein
MEVDRHLFAAAAEFEAIELAPVAPLGVCAAVALASQNKIVSTVRGTEVVSDPTNVLALECARRLVDGGRAKAGGAGSVEVRPGEAGSVEAGSVGAGRGSGLALAEHINTHLAALDRLSRNGYAISTCGVRLLAIERNAELARRVAAEVRGASVEHEVLDHAYYDGIRFMIDVLAPDGSRLPLIDGGAFDWLRKLTSNNKLAYVASGMGSQLVASLFRR